MNKHFSRLSNSVVHSRYSLPKIFVFWWWTKTSGNWPQPELSYFTQNMGLPIISGKGMNKETLLKSALKKYRIYLCSLILKILDAGTLLFLSSRPYSARVGECTLTLPPANPHWGGSLEARPSPATSLLEKQWFLSCWTELMWNVVICWCAP